MYIEKRQNAVKEIPESELDAMLKAVVDAFGEGWLSDPTGTHALQALWNRKDFLATNELLTLGYSITRLKAHTAWLKVQLTKSKGNDLNNSRGALFELIGLGMFESDDFEVVPAPDGFPGIDGSLHFKNGAKLRLSLKNYDVSVHHRAFLQKSAEIWKWLQERLLHDARPPLQVLAFSQDKTPSDTDWKELVGILEKGLTEYKGSAFALVLAPWLVTFSRLGNDHGEFARSPPSASLLVAAKYHENEERNLLSKLDAARANLEKHTKAENEGAAIFIRMPPDASIHAALNWSNAYLDENQVSPLGAVILYQPVVTSDQKARTTGISFHVAVAPGRALERWRERSAIVGPAFELAPLIGRPVLAPPIQKIVIGQREVVIEGFYTFQKGNLFVKAVEEAPGRLSGEVRQIGDGVFVHTVFEIGGRDVQMSGRFPPSHSLLIL